MGRDRRHGRAGAGITIADDGRGIRRELRDKVFERFFSTKAERAPASDCRASRAAVLRNDGTIGWRSAVTGSHRGTCVRVLLPTAAEAGIHAEFK